MHEGSPSLTYDNIIPNPLEHSHVSTFCSQPSSSSLELDLDVLSDIFELCESNVDLGHENSMFDVVRFESTQTQEGVNCVGKFSAVSGNKLRPCSDRVFVPSSRTKIVAEISRREIKCTRYFYAVSYTHLTLPTNREV